eukprot:TRINITY_DN39573_c0_g1_i1.p1 TRINITY_DN39573_c0_g1~~TRINITY_DN39573_c0_g1_i1.p1  ORF type:complete len:681 (+),score=79.33 TRINITY_DN39573_c0_g1_i1:262-2043(+)
MYIAVVQTDVKARRVSIPLWADITEKLFMTFYVSDILFRIYLVRFDFFSKPSNLFDMAIVGIDILASLLDGIVGNVGPVSLLRAARTLRIVRLVRSLKLFRDLYLMMKGLEGALRAIIFATLLIFIVLTMFSILSVELFNDIVKQIVAEGGYDNCDRCSEAFSSVWSSYLTFFQTIVAGDSWGLYNLPLISKHPWTSIPITIVFATVELGLLNVIIAVVVDRQMQARQDDTELMHAMKLENESQNFKELQAMFHSVDGDGNGKLTFEELEEAYESKPAFRAALDLIDIRKEDLGTVYGIMDQDKSGHVEADEFIKQLHQMKSSDQRTLMFVMNKRSTDIKDDLKQLTVNIQEMLERHELKFQQIEENFENAMDRLGMSEIVKHSMPSPRPRANSDESKRDISKAKLMETKESMMQKAPESLYTTTSDKIASYSALDVKLDKLQHTLDMAMAKSMDETLQRLRIMCKSWPKPLEQPSGVIQDSGFPLRKYEAEQPQPMVYDDEVTLPTSVRTPPKMNSCFSAPACRDSAGWYYYGSSPPMNSLAFWSRMDAPGLAMQPLSKYDLEPAKERTDTTVASLAPSRSQWSCSESGRRV